MKQAYYCIAFFCSLLLFSCASQKQVMIVDHSFIKQIDKLMFGAFNQYKTLKQARPRDSFPKTWHPDKEQYEWSGSGWWCSGFYPGTLIYLTEQIQSGGLLNEAERMLSLLEKEQFNKNTHDLGFMMYCSYGNANRFHGGGAKIWEKILVNSAKSLSSRFDSVTGCIRSWNSKNPDDFIVIIDNMMNLELLFWATKQTGDSSFYKIAVTHANTTMKNHFREDNSSYHVVNYSAKDGSVKEKKTAQGYSNSSAWARGQAWGLYGYTLMYRETKDLKYLEQATRIASFILDHLPADKIPYWDFNAPDIPNALRDASAGAIMASALLELQAYDSKNRKRYINTSETILKKLSSPEYLAAEGTNGGFILKHSVGHKPNNTEVDVPLTYADYYFIEALIRYKMLAQKPVK